MVPLVYFAVSCFLDGKKIHVWKHREATLTSLPSDGNEMSWLPFFWLSRPKIWRFASIWGLWLGKKPAIRPKNENNHISGIFHSNCKVICLKILSLTKEYLLKLIFFRFFKASLSMSCISDHLRNSTLSYHSKI